MEDCLFSVKRDKTQDILQGYERYLINGCGQMIDGKANNNAAHITQTDRSAEHWKHPACYFAVPMNDGMS
jgi:hypothetical protein